jgi:nucleoside-diphosphate-sugar epimerase
MKNGERYEGVPVLVLGAAGFIGRWVARALTDQRAELFLGVRQVSTAAETLDRVDARGELIACDLEEPANVRSLIDRVRPAVVFNLAGYGVDPTERTPEIAELINARLVEHLAGAVASHEAQGWTGQRVVHVGSALEYGTAGGNLSEDSSPEPTTVYGRSKLAGTLALQAICRSRGLRGVTARLFTVYGAGEHSSRLLPTLLKARHSDGPIDLTDGRQERDFTYVEDVADGLLRLGLSPAPPGAVVNLATGRLTPVRSFVETAADVLGLARPRLRFGALATRSEEMHHDAVTIDRLARMTSWQPSTSIDAGIARASTRFDALTSQRRIENEICQ